MAKRSSAKQINKQANAGAKGNGEWQKETATENDGNEDNRIADAAGQHPAY